MTDDTFTNGNSPDEQDHDQEQPYESAVADTTAFIERYHAADESSGYPPGVGGTIGSGITHPQSGADSDDHDHGENQ